MKKKVHASERSISEELSYREIMADVSNWKVSCLAGLFPFVNSLGETDIICLRILKELNEGTLH